MTINNNRYVPLPPTYSETSSLSPMLPPAEKTAKEWRNHINEQIRRVLLKFPLKDNLDKEVFLEKNKEKEKDYLSMMMWVGNDFPKLFIDHPEDHALIIYPDGDWDTHVWRNSTQNWEIQTPKNFRERPPLSATNWNGNNDVEVQYLKEVSNVLDLALKAISSDKTF